MKILILKPAPGDRYVATIKGHSLSVFGNTTEEAIGRLLSKFFYELGIEAVYFEDEDEFKQAQQE